MKKDEHVNNLPIELHELLVLILRRIIKDKNAFKYLTPPVKFQDAGTCLAEMVMIMRQYK